MTNESVQVLQNEYVHRLHSPRGQPGKLYRGQTKFLAPASIPSKYQTVIIDNSDKKGFMSNSKRFNYETWVDDKPGPGSYVGLPASSDTDSVSLSKRGTGMFASKNSRMPKSAVAPGPAPNSYSVPAILGTRSDFNRSTVSGPFHSPIATHRSKSTGPAPNQYDVLSVAIGRANNVHADAAFKSRTKREITSAGDENKPSPCQYNVHVQDNVRVPLSSFKSRSARQFPPPPSANPGPGQYRPHEPVTEHVTRTIFPRHNYLLLAAPAMKLPSQPQLPGPGSYDLHSSFHRSNTAASSAFVSSGRRWSADVNAAKLPGPAHYNPTRIGKQSFIYNSNSRWI